MSRSFPRPPVWRRGLSLAIAVPVLGVLAVVAPIAQVAASAASAPSVTVTGAGGSPYTNGAVVSVSVGPNSFFVPNARIEVIECAAPKGVDPLSDVTCDGNTAQSGSVIVASDGSFGIPRYTLYSLPNTSLEETADGEPVCNATSECVLYVGQNQNDFTAPKVFSAPFTVAPTPGATPVAAHHGRVPGAPITGVSPAVAAAGASSVHPIPAATTPTTSATAAQSHSPGSSAASGTSNPAADPRPAPAVAGSAANPSEGPLSPHGVVLWLVVLGVLLALAGVVGFRWRKRSPG